MKLLIVEDEAKIANSLKRGFTEENYTVDLAYEGDKGYILARDEEYDVIILDLMLPKMDGVSILRQLRNIRKTTPVIILTAKGSTEDKVKGLNNGADDYLSKPFAFEELLARVRSLIRRSNNNDNILKVDDLELNPFTHIVNRGGKDIAVSAKEFSILEYLMRHKGAIMSESQIINNIWDYNFEGMSNFVAVHMKNLRNKIDKASISQKSLIKTIRGIGYKIDES